MLTIRSHAAGCIRPVIRGTISVLTRGGLQDGISAALAPPVSGAEKPAILPATYGVVIFTLVVQELSLRILIERVLK